MGGKFIKRSISDSMRMIRKNEKHSNSNINGIKNGGEMRLCLKKIDWDSQWMESDRMRMMDCGFGMKWWNRIKRILIKSYSLPMDNTFCFPIQMRHRMLILKRSS